MSEDTKKQAEQIKKFFETVKEGGEQLTEKSKKFDKELTTKIEKVKEGAQEIVKHIEERTKKG